MSLALRFNNQPMDSSTQLLSSDSSAIMSEHRDLSFTEISRKRRRTRNDRNKTKIGSRPLPQNLSPTSAQETAHTTTNDTKEFMIDLMGQWDNETLVLVHLAKSYKTIKLTKRKSSTGRNILRAENHAAAQTLSNLKSLFGKSIRFLPLDPNRKITTATMLRVPHPISPEDILELVPEIKEAERLTVWSQEAKTTVQTRSIKIKWEGTKLPGLIDLGILGRYETKLFVHPPVRCYKCQKYNHTSSTCHARGDTCGLCGGHHRTKVCVDKRNANQEIKLRCSNCKGDHSTASGRCPYRQEMVLRFKTSTSTATTSTSPDKSASQVSMDIQPSCHQTIDIFTEKPAFEPIPNAIASTALGGIPRHTANDKENGGSHPRGYKQHTTAGRYTGTDSQDSPGPTSTNSTKETSTFRGLETDCKEANKSTTESTKALA